MQAKRTWALALASIASLMIALDLLVVTTALSTIRTDLGASIEDLQWTVTGYSLSFAALLMTGGALGDRFGRRRMFAVGLAIFVAASSACALADSIGALVAARVAQGVGAALVIPVALALVSAAYSADERGTTSEGRRSGSSRASPGWRRSRAPSSAVPCRERSRGRRSSGSTYRSASGRSLWR